MIAPRVLIRADGGPGVGLGHVRRCLALATALRAREADVTVVVPDHPALRTVVTESGFAVEAVLSGEAATLLHTRSLVQTWGAVAAVIDSYETPGDALRPPLAAVTAVIDDLGVRDLPVDLVIAPAASDARQPFEALPGTTVLAGLAYVILHPDFARPVLSNSGGPIERVLLTLGGGDPGGLTVPLVDAVSQAVPTAHIDVVIGPLASDRLADTIARQRARVHVHRPVATLAELIEVADLAVCGGGQTLYELAARGVPAVAVEVAENQRPNLEMLEALGTVRVAGSAADTFVSARVTQLVQELAADPARREAMSAAGRRAVDGRGAARVAEALLGRVALVRGVGR